MNPFSSVHTRTPTLSVVDPRGLAVRQVAFCRTQPGDDASVRINRSAHDVAGRLVRSWDPRLWLAATNDPTSAGNLNVIHSLTGQVLHSQHVDAGWRLELPGEAGQRHLRRDAQGYGQRAEYDQLLRPVAMFESDGVSERCLERFTYGGPATGDANQCGQLIRHDDPAGSVINAEFGLTGAVLEQTRRFLKNLETPDWPQALNERYEWLEPGEGSVTRSRFSATGEMVEQTDAIGAVRLFELTVGGQPSRSTLQLPDQAPQTLVRNIRYDAQGRFESETAGNGHLTERTYDLADGRLRRQQVDNGRLQDLTYATDPVGNIVSIEDRAQPTRFFANQQIEPLRTFGYDTLYQLTEATGYEAASLNRGPQTAQRTFATADQLSNYTQRYEYDAGGNLQRLTHSGAQNHTRLFATANFSNRSLLQTDECPPTQEQIAAGFDANGNLRQLAPGQALRWDLRNQLSEVTPVERESGINDREVYQYDAAGARVRKVRVTQTKELTHLSEVRYLPGLEIRSNSASGEVLHVITATAGRSNVRALHWQAGCPTDLPNNQIRLSLTDHLGSSTLELDKSGQLISQEVYYPYGETAWYMARSEVEAKYKTIRYSGKERDATRLYYYGLRYYAPWLCRWVNPDPEGVAGGINLFGFCLNSPMQYRDREGASPYDVMTEHEMSAFEQYGVRVVARGLMEFPTDRRFRVKQAAGFALELLQRTLDLLEKPDAEMTKVIKTMFGKIDTKTKHDVLDRLKRELGIQHQYIADLIGHADEKISLFEGASTPSGLTWGRDERMSEGTIGLNNHLLIYSHPLEIANTLIHEASHATSGTEDYFYFAHELLPRSAKGVDFRRRSRQLRAKFFAINNNGPESVDNLVTNDYITAMAQDHKLPTEMTRSVRFVGDPQMRADILLSNADTYSAFVMATKGPATILKRHSARSVRSFWRR